MFSYSKEYAQVLVGTPKIHEGMEPVSPEVPHDCTTFCKQVRLKHTFVVAFYFHCIRFKPCQFLSYQEKNCSHSL